jgi:hypothetical protein
MIKNLDETAEKRDFVRNLKALENRIKILKIENQKK